jgi:pantoate kinase
MAPQASRFVHQVLSKVTLIQAQDFAKKLLAAPSLSETLRLKAQFAELLGLP